MNSERSVGSEVSAWWLLRYWLIEKLAGDHLVVLNSHIRYARNTTGLLMEKGDMGLVACNLFECVEHPTVSIRQRHGWQSPARKEFA